MAAPADAHARADSRAPAAPVVGPRRLYLPPFRVDLEVRPGVRPPVPPSRLARALCAALWAGGAPEPAAVGLILSDDGELARLNRAHMAHRGPTDVLSFPLLPPSVFPDHPRSRSVGGARGRERRPSMAGAVSCPDLHEDRAFLLPPGTRLHLGDVVISVERAIAQAEEGRGGQSGDLAWEPADELRLLAVHGGLHLCGWDHAEEPEASAMRALERALLGGADRT